MDHYITPAELRRIAEACEAMRPLWEVLTGRDETGLYFEHDEAPRIDVSDANGRTLGHITWCDSGAAFFPTQEES